MGQRAGDAAFLSAGVFHELDRMHCGRTTLSNRSSCSAGPTGEQRSIAVGLVGVVGGCADLRPSRADSILGPPLSQSGMVCEATRPPNLLARDISPLACPQRDQIYANLRICASYHRLRFRIRIYLCWFSPCSVACGSFLVRPDTTKRHGLSFPPQVQQPYGALPCETDLRLAG